MNPLAEIQQEPRGGLGSQPARLAELERADGQVALTDSEVKLAGILHALTDHIHMIDENLNILWANEAAMSSFGPGLVGRKCFEARHQRDRPCDHCVAAMVFRDGQTRHHEHQMPIGTGDGTERWFWCTTSVAGRHPEGRPKTLIIVSRDITERKRSEEGLREATMREMQAARAGNVGLWDWDLATNEVRYSAEWKRQIGYQEHEIGDDFEEWRSRVHPDDLKSTLEQIQRCIAEARQDYEVEFRFRHKDGSYHWILACGSVLRGKDALPIRMLGTHVDITERKRAEDALRRSETRFRTLTETSPVGIFQADTRGNGVYVNNAVCRFTGRSYEDHLGDGWAEALHPDDRAPVAESWRRTVEGKDDFHREFRFVAPDGRVTWLASQAAPLTDESGETTGLIGTLTDITKRKNAEAQSARLESELAHAARVSTMGEMAAGIAHELNQPLTVVVSRATACALAIGSRSPKPAEILDDLAEIASQAERAGEIIRRFRLLSTKRQFKRSSLDVNGMVREVAEFLRHDIHMNRVALRLKLARKVPRVLADPVQIQQVLLNLMRNAIEAMTSVEDGVRELIIQTSASSPEAVEVAIRDTGPGVEEGDLEKLFEPFFTRKGEGLGMGLAICRTIMEAHGGCVWATRNPKRGTTFHFTLPLPGLEPDHASSTQCLRS